jgi:hypothetical protein
MLLAGGLVACVSAAQKPIPRVASIPIAGAVALVALVLLVPIGVADRALRDSRDPANEKSGRALELAESAAKAEHWWGEPEIRIAQLEANAGHSTAAASAARAALTREPGNWSIQNAAAVFLHRTDPKGSGRAKAEAYRLNPLLKRQDEAVAKASAKQR